MRMISYCAVCKSRDITYLDENNEFLEGGKCFCRECGKVTDEREEFVMSPYERTRAAVYATGNRWAIENFNATHN